MQNSIILILTLLSAALGQSCNGLNQVCAAYTCPAASNVQFGSSSYSPSDFNLISFGSLTINSGDVEGRVAVQQNFNAPKAGVSIGHSLPSVSSPSNSLVAGGNVNWVNGEIYPTGSGLTVGGSFTGVATLAAKVSGACSSSGCYDSQFSTLSSYYTSLTNTLAALEATTTTAVSFQQLVITCTGSSSVYVVAVGVSVFNSINSFSTSGCNDDATFLFNIMGSDKVVFQGRAFPSTQTVYNLPMATDVEINTFVLGDIIATSATLVGATAGTVTGQVIAKDVTLLIQVNLPLCPNTTATSTSASTADSATSTSGVPSASSTSTSGTPSATTTGTTTGGNGDSICTFLDDQASCPDVNNALNGDYTFRFSAYDVVVFGDLNANSGDIEGRTFAYGNVNFANGMFSLGLRADANNNTYVLVAGGLNFASGSISHGRAFVGGSSSVASYLQKYVDGPCTSSGCLDSIRSAGQSCYGGVSDTFAGRSNAAISMNGNQAVLTCNSNSDSVYYINVDSSMIGASSWSSFTNCNGEATYVFNIGGSDDFSFSGAAFPNNNAVYNVRGSRTVTISTSVHGVVLAPNANVVMNSGLIVGKLVANTATIVQVNLIPECVDVGSGTGTGNFNTGNAQSGSSAGINVTPSILVMIVALFISKLF